MTKIEELRASYAAATSGEWVAPGFNSQGGKVACLLDNHDGLRLVSGNFKRPDAEFIALSHNNMAALLEAVERLEAMQRVIGELASMNPFLRDVFDTNKTVLERLR